MSDAKTLDSLSNEDADVLSLVSQLQETFTRVLANHQKEVEGLKQEIAKLDALTAGFIKPDYGMLPVKAQFFEAVVDIAAARGVSPGTLLQEEKVNDHLMELIYKEII